MDYWSPNERFVNFVGRLSSVRFVYRVHQFWHALTRVPAASELEQARRMLSPSLWALFLGLQASEQAHGLSIFRRLCEQGDAGDDLLAAALLHDVGKSRYPLHIWERVWIVLGQAFFPGQAKAWGRADPKGWRRPFVVAEQHPAWGAEMAARAGASPMTVALIKRHQDAIEQDWPAEEAAGTLESRLLRRLQMLDNES